MKLRLAFALLGLVVLNPHLWAQGNFVYTNNDTIPNTVSGFAVGKDGVLTEVPGSRFLTGGDGAMGSDGRYFASNRIRTRKFLYASNARSNTVSGFSIDPESGGLTPVPGSPFATGGLARLGISLAASPDGRFMYAGSSSSGNVRVFRIGSDGELEALGPPVPAGEGPNGMVVSADGRWLAVALSEERPHGLVAMYSIDQETGELTPVEGSPFPVRPPGEAEGRVAGLDINCASDTLFVGEGTINGTTIVDVLNIDSETGALTPVKSSPFTPGVGSNSNVVLLSPDDGLLFVSHQNYGPGGRAVSVFTVAEDRTLALVEGSPFPVGDIAELPAGMATDVTGAFLYVTALPDLVGVFSINKGGVLTPVPGSPFGSGQQLLGRFSLAAFPPKTCPGKGEWAKP